MSRLDTHNSLLAGICRCRKSLSSVNCGCKIQTLQYVQNNVSRVTHNAWNYDHVTPILSHLHLPAINYRIQLKVLTTVFKCMHNMAPIYLSDLIVLYEPSLLDYKLKDLFLRYQGLIWSVQVTRLSLISIIIIIIIHFC